MKGSKEKSCELLQEVAACEQREWHGNEELWDIEEIYEDEQEFNAQALVAVHRLFCSQHPYPSSSVSYLPYFAGISASPESQRYGSAYKRSASRKLLHDNLDALAGSEVLLDLSLIYRYVARRKSNSPSDIANTHT